MPAASRLIIAMVTPKRHPPDMEYSTSIIELSQFPSKNLDPPFPSGVSLLSARERSSESCNPQGPSSSTIHTSHRRPEAYAHKYFTYQCLSCKWNVARLNPAGKASVPHSLGNRIAERRVPRKPLLVHASQHRHHHIRIVVDVDFTLVVVETMQAAHVLLQSTFPRNRHCKKKRIKTWVVKSLAEVTSGRQDHARFIARNGC